MYKNLPFDARSITAPDFPSSSTEFCTGMKILSFPYVNTDTSALSFPAATAACGPAPGAGGAAGPGWPPGHAARAPAGQAPLHLR